MRFSPNFLCCCCFVELVLALSAGCRDHDHCPMRSHCHSFFFLLLFLVACNLSLIACIYKKAVNVRKTTGSGGSGTTITLEDSQISWLTWSKWRCNCPAGSMSRMRDVKYQVPGITLGDTNLNLKRYQRVVCDYKECNCNRTLGQCDQARVECTDMEEYECALNDIAYASRHLIRKLWTTIDNSSHSIWERLKLVYPGKTTQNKKNKKVTN